MEDRKIRLEFTLYPDKGSYWRYSTFQQEIDEDISIADFCDFCRTCASILGYSEDLINQYFREQDN